MKKGDAAEERDETQEQEAREGVSGRAFNPAADSDSAMDERVRSQIAESILVERARSGDSEAFAELIRDRYPRLVSSVRRIVRNDADAEDIVQDALLSAFVHLADYQHKASFSTWLFRITVNRAVEFLRKVRHGTVALEDLRARRGAEPDSWPAESITPETICLSREADRILQDCIGRLRPLQRTVLALVELQGLGNQDVATQLRVSDSTVKTRLHRGRRKLRRLLVQRYRVDFKAPVDGTLSYRRRKQSRQPASKGSGDSHRTAPDRYAA